MFSPNKHQHRPRGQGNYEYVLLVTPVVLCVFWLLVQWARPTVLEQASPQKESLQSFGAARQQQYLLRHVFHHGAGRRYRTHRRLDITPDFLRRVSAQHERDEAPRPPLLSHAPLDPSSTHSFDPNSLHDVYSQYDWPEAFSDSDPWTILLPVKTAAQPVRITRLAERHTPNFLDSYFQNAVRVKGKAAKLSAIHLEWEPEVPVAVPDVSDKGSLVSLALMSSNAYERIPEADDPDKLDWVDLGDPWNVDDDPDLELGWLHDGLRGHVFVSENNKTVVLALKGTSGAMIPGGGSDESSANDKINDNLLFLCCCARVSNLWRTVCDCYEKAYTCNQDCLENELVRKDRYYQATIDFYLNITKLYPPETTDIWVTGHSLGGALASLLGRTFGLPTVAFEAPGEMLATDRLHLPKAPGLPPHLEYIWHVGNTADPVFMGDCNSVSLSCSLAGYAMESMCHTGQLCVYDVVNDWGWHLSILNHRVHTVIDKIILAYNSTPECVPQPPCRDCFNWRYTSSDGIVDDPPVSDPLQPTSSNTELLSELPTATSRTATRLPLPTETNKPRKCLKRTWYGWCLKWNDDESDD